MKLYRLTIACALICLLASLASAEPRPLVLQESALLQPPDASWEAFGRFGVAIDGDWALVSGERDNDNDRGNWPIANQDMASALKYKGYDYQFVFGDGGHNLRQAASISLSRRPFQSASIRRNGATPARSATTRRRSSQSGRWSRPPGSRTS